MNREVLKGKRAIINIIAKDPNLQRRMRETNNCKAVGFWCKNCPVPTFHRCWDKVRRELVMEAFIKVKDTPTYKREQEKIEKDLIYLKK